MSKLSGTSKIQFLIDSKGLCLLCFADILSNEILKENASDATKEESDVQFSAEGSKDLQSLSRYLQIDLQRVLNFQGTLHSEKIPLDNSELLVALCSGCCRLLEKFSRLQKELELLQMHFNATVRELHGVTNGAQNDHKRMSEFKQRMVDTAKNPLQLVQSTIVDNLRKVIIEKCFSRMKKEFPQIIVKRCQKRAYPAMSCAHTSPKKMRLVAHNRRFHYQNHSFISRELQKSPGSSRATYRYFCKLCNEAIRNVFDHIQLNHPEEQANYQGISKELFITTTYRDKAGHLRYHHVCKLCHVRVQDPKKHEKTHANTTQENLLPEMEMDTAAKKQVVAEFMFPVRSGAYLDKNGTRRSRAYYYCKICDKTVTNRAHGEIHSAEPFKCSYCSATFTTRLNRSRHIILNHSEHHFSTLRQPNVSQREFREIVRLAITRNVKKSTVLGEPKQTCIICGMGFDGSTANFQIRNHLIRVHYQSLAEQLLSRQQNNNVRSCPKCNHTMYSINEYLQHACLITAKSEGTFSEANKAIITPPSPPDNLTSSPTNDKKLPCSHCSQWFAIRRNLKHHQLRMHPEIFFASDPKLRNIPNDTLRAAVINLLEAEGPSQWNEPSLQCPYCNTTFNYSQGKMQKFYFRVHLVSNHIERMHQKLTRNLELQELHLQQGDSWKQDEEVKVPKILADPDSAASRRLYSCNYCGLYKSKNFYGCMHHRYTAHVEQEFLHLKPADLSNDEFRTFVQLLFEELRDVHQADEAGRSTLVSCCPHCAKSSTSTGGPQARVGQMRQHMVQFHRELLTTQLIELLTNAGKVVVEPQDNQGKIDSFVPLFDLGYGQVDMDGEASCTQTEGEGQKPTTKTEIEDLATSHQWGAEAISVDNFLNVEMEVQEGDENEEEPKVELTLFLDEDDQYNGQTSTLQDDPLS